MFKYSYDALVYCGEPIEKSIARVAQFGYDAIELMGEPDQFDTKVINRCCDSEGIVVSSVCSIFTAERDMIHPDVRVRNQAMDYVKSVLDFAAETGAEKVIISTTACNKTAPLVDIEQETAWAVENVRAMAEIAQKSGITLCLESWNRYETYMADSLEKVSRLAKRINMPNVGIMGDTFHMNIEEADMAGSIRKFADQIVHMHLADSQRAAPGKGHIDFVPIVKALKDIQYDGWIVFELLPAGGDPFAVMRAGGCDEFLDEYTELSIKTIKEIEKQLEK
jgi:sugar phosphate isomerase/epimerase